MGYPVRVEGPFGSAFHRPNQSNRLVLVGSGTGFAPVWAIAVAALHEDPECSICLIGAARTFDSLYIMSALELAANFPNTSVVACVGDLDEPLDSIMPGSPLVHLPKDLGSDDIVYGAGGPSFIDVLGRICASSEASFFSDPFEPASPPRVSWTEKAKAWIAAI
jgi:3-phenylpropionate/trans-cinnamate dioxygenase ferredoxin reductase subunit